MDAERGHAVSASGLMAIVEAVLADEGTEYRRLWLLLKNEDRVPDALELRRARLKIALETVNDS